MVLGLALLFCAERYFASETYHLALIVISLLLLAFSKLATVIVASITSKEGYAGEAKSWLFLLPWQMAVIASVLLYLVYVRFMGVGAAPDTLMQKVVLASWLLLLILGSFAGIGLEMSHAVNGRGHHVEPRRVLRAGLSWLMVGMVLSIVVCINYAGSKRDRTYDWSYLKATTPGDASRAMVKTLAEKVEISVFFPQDNEVRPFVAEYFQSLSQGSEMLTVQFLDKDLDPLKAEEMRISRNGQVILSQGEKRERLDIGLKISGARKKLKKLDEEFQAALLKLTQKKKVAYFTRGHGELSWLADSQNPLMSIRLIETYLRNQNYSLRTFGMAEGSASAVPDDASVVIVAGPTQPFMKEEVQVLKDYLAKGGRVALLLDVAKPGAGTPAIDTTTPDPLLEFLAGAGLTYKKELLANEQNYVSATRSQVDKWFLFTNVFTSHESVASLAKHEERVPMLLFQTGYFVVEANKGPWRSFETVRALSGTFNDVNRNFTFDQKTEKKDTYPVGVASVFSTDRKEGDKAIEGKLIAFADATAFSDAVVGAGPPGNVLYLADSLKWMVGEAELIGGTTSEEDVKIQHSKKEDTVWFYSSIFGVPTMMLFMGFVATRRKRSRSR